MAVQYGLPFLFENIMYTFTEISGIIFKFDEASPTGRTYNREQVLTSVEKMQEKIRSTDVFCEFGNVFESELLSINICGKLIKLDVDNNTVSATIQLLHKLRCGEEVNRLLHFNQKFILSSRGIGTLSDTCEITDYELLTVDLKLASSDIPVYLLATAT